MPVIWKSQLQTEITMSTLEAEYSALSSSLRVLIPLRNTLVELVNVICSLTSPSILCRVFEGNNGALLLATKQQRTNRTKYFLVKWHFFWECVRKGEVLIEMIDTTNQQADYLTKGLDRATFERIRRMVQGW